MSDFKPPKNNRFFEWLGRTGMPFVLWWNNYERVVIADEDVRKLRALTGQRTIICSNHSHRHDPFFMFELASILNEQFNFIAAREIFDRWPFHLHGYCIQRVGAYSINRGTVDRASIAMSKQLIMNGERKLVVFPECEISDSDDRLLPIDPGLAGLFLKSMEAVQRMAPGAPVNVLPVGMKYHYTTDISATLSYALTRLENELQIDNSQEELPLRFNLAVREWVNIIASEYSLAHANWANSYTIADFDSVINGLLRHIADYFGTDVSGKDAPHAVHVLRNRMCELMKTEGYQSRYQKSVHAERSHYLKRFDRLFTTVLRLAALREFHVLSGVSQENLAGGIDVLEREIFGKATQKGRRIVTIRVGDAVNLTERADQFKQDRRGEVQWLTNNIEQQLRIMLNIPTASRANYDEREAA